MVIKSLKVTAVNMPVGTITVMWNEDHSMEWNYNIPLGDNGSPLLGDDLLRYLIAQSYESVRSVLERREVDFSQHSRLLKKKFNLEIMVGEYEQIIRELGSVPPSQRM